VRREKSQTKHRDPRVAFATIGVFVAVLCLIASTADKVGLTYDERIYMAIASRVGQWLGILASGDISHALSKDAIDTYWSTKDQHPGFLKLLAAVTVPLGSPVLPPMSAYRVATALLFAAMCAGMFRFLMRYGWVAAATGVGSLVTMPSVFAHAQLLTLDVPCAAMSFLATLAFVRTTESPRWGWFLALGALLGLAIGCKLNAFFVPLVLVVWWAMFHRKHFGRYALACLVVAPAVFILTWPALWRDTIPKLSDYVAFHLGHYPIPVSYFGRVYVDPPAPWHYPFVMTAITTPPVVILLWALGLSRSIVERGRDRVVVLFLMSAAVQMLVVALPSVPKYNGVRLFVSAFPYLCAVGGIGLAWAMDSIGRRAGASPGRAMLRPDGPVFRLIPFLLLVPSILGIAEVYPFEMSYYSPLVGGTPGAVKLGFEPTYWGESYGAATQWLFAKAPVGARIAVLPPGVLSTLVEFYRVSGVRPDLVFVAGEDDMRQADYVMFHTRRGELTPDALRLLDDGRPLFAVTHDGTPTGVPLCVVYTRDGIHRVLGKGNGSSSGNTRDEAVASDDRGA